VYGLSENAIIPNEKLIRKVAQERSTYRNSSYCLAEISLITPFFNILSSVMEMYEEIAMSAVQILTHLFWVLIASVIIVGAVWAKEN